MRVFVWFLLGFTALTVGLFFAAPLYLAIAAFADGVTILPSTRDERLVAAALVAVIALPYWIRLIVTVDE